MRSCITVETKLHYSGKNLKIDSITPTQNNCILNIYNCITIKRQIIASPLTDIRIAVRKLIHISTTLGHQQVKKKDQLPVPKTI